MLKVNDSYYPSVNIFGEWYFIVKKDGKLHALPNKPKKGLSLDRATTIENEYRNKIYNYIELVARFSNKLVNDPIENIIPENIHEETIIQTFINKCKKFLSQPTRSQAE